jgi:hypothetical protein
MIAWYWLIPALLAGGFLGFLTMALCVMTKGPDEGTD